VDDLQFFGKMLPIVESVVSPIMSDDRSMAVDARDE
jgi:hypothetical protein